MDSSRGSDPTKPANLESALPSERVGKFVRSTKLGAGGMGEVWKAWDTQLARWVALKFLRGGDENEIARFRREAQTAGRLTHPNIAAIFEVGEHEGRHYIAMQHVEGRTLKGFARADHRLIAAMIRDAARAVAYAHAQKVIHRDLKPENMMADGAGRLFVMDFGLARAVEGGSQLSISGQVLGTPSYMPPEQARAGRTDVRSDVYSLGATLYDLLTGRPPFRAATVLDTLAQVQDREPEPPRRIDPRVDRDLETIVLTCLEKEPARRYPTAAALADDVQRWLDGEPISASRASIAYRLVKRLRKRPVAWSLGAAAVLALAAAGVLLSRASSDLSAAERAGQISGAYYDLTLKTLRAMEKLEDHFNDVVLPGAELEQALADVDARARAAAAKHPATRLPDAWRALARVLARREGALGELEEAARKAGDDPFPHVLLARAHLAQYAEQIKLPDISFGRGVVLDPLADTEALRALRERTAEALRSALASPLWPRLKHGGEYLVYAEGASLLSQARPAEAAAKLAPLKDEPVLRDEAARLCGIAFLLAQRFDEAARVWEGLAKRGWPAASVNAGMCHYAVGAVADDPRPHLERAQAILDETLRQSPNRPFAFSYRGLVHVARGDWEERHGLDSMASFERAVADLKAASEHPRLVLTRATLGSARCALAGSLVERGRDPMPQLDAAIEDVAEAIARRPDRPQPWHTRAEARRSRARWRSQFGDDPVPACEQAIADDTEALRLQPDYPRARQGRALSRVMIAEALVKRGRDARAHLDAAFEDLDAVVAANPQEPPVWSARGSAWRVRGDAEMQAGADPGASFDRAIADLSEALRLRPSAGDLVERAHVLIRLAVARMGQGDAIDRALRDIAEAERLRPESTHALEARANASVIRGHAEAGRGGDAIAWYERAIEAYTALIGKGVDPPGMYANRATAHAAKGIAELRLGRDARASHEAVVADCERCLRGEPENADALAYCGRALFRLGRPRESVERLSAALRARPGVAMWESWLKEARRAAGE